MQDILLELRELQKTIKLKESQIRKLIKELMDRKKNIYACFCAIVKKECPYTGGKDIAPYWLWKDLEDTLSVIERHEEKDEVLEMMLERKREG